MKKLVYLIIILAAVLILLLLLGKKDIYTEIVINAPANKVWAELTDFSKYPEWNPIIKKVTGEIKAGNTIEVIFLTQGGSPFVLNPEVKTYEAESILEWEGKLILPGIFTGKHTYQLIKTDKNQTKFIQKEKFNGILVPFYNFKSTIEGFNSMNNILKDRAESEK